MLALFSGLGGVLLRDLTRENLPHRATVYAPGSSVVGGVTKPSGFTVVAEGVRCRLTSNGRGSERIAADAVKARAPWKVAFLPGMGATILTQHELEIIGEDERGNAFVRRVRVTAVDAPDQPMEWACYGEGV